jgi:hypothetical protein
VLYSFHLYESSGYESEYSRSGYTGERFDIGANQDSGSFDAFIPLFAGVDPGGTVGNAQNGRENHRLCGKSQ